jgi:trypsin
MLRILTLTIALLSPFSANADLHTTIVGGQEAVKGEFPFIVSLQGSDGHFCGGSLIRPDWVLTAAHCVAYESPSEIIIGLHDQNNKAGSESFRPAAVIKHAKYNSGTMDFDYALIRLNGKSKFAPIPLNQAALTAGLELTVAGWGATKEGNYRLPAKLQKVSVPLVDKDVCNAAYGGEITDRMVCGGLPQGGKDSCQGDSGGPLFANVAGVRTLVGVVSWGEGCARANKYGIYSNVSAGYTWIIENIGR